MKTYALFDVIGIKKSISEGTAYKKLSEFWKVVDGWTEQGYETALPLANLKNKSRLVRPDPFVMTYSDTALMHMGTEIDLIDFYKLTFSLKEKIKNSIGKCYVIINCDEDVAHHELPVIGSRRTGPDGKQRYVNIGGSGKAFVNIHMADAALKNFKTWHSQYTVFCVGECSRPQYLECKAKETFKGYSNLDYELLALQ